METYAIHHQTHKDARQRRIDILRKTRSRVRGSYVDHQSPRDARRQRMKILRRNRLRVRPLHADHQSTQENRHPMEIQRRTRPIGRRPHRDLHRMRNQRITERWGFGRRTGICPYCKALMWKEEKLESSTINFPKFGMCCQSRKIMLPLIPPHPEFLDLKFKDSKFKEHIRSYNSMLSFTSMGGKIDRSVSCGRGPYAFRIGGENAHRIGSLLPPPGEKPKFAQLYIYDTAHKIRNRVDAVTSNDQGSDIDLLTVEGLQSMLNSVNPYVKVFRNARDIIQENGVRDLQIRILNSRGRSQYTKPVADEIAALIVGDGTEELQNRDIILSTTDGMLKRIDETHPSYMPLQYPLLFPFGTDGWRRFIPFARDSNNSREGISMRQFYAFRLQCREEECKTILLGGRLLQQYSVDCYAAIEQNRLTFVKLNQSKLRADVYKGLEYAVTVGDTNATAIGKRYILPSSFTGGPRNMIQRYQDAMAICRAIGTPDYFITFTCNPNWPEIQEDVRGMFSQRTEDRPDVVARVFRIMLKNIMKCFKQEGFLGKVIADMHVIEFQKRGLPHAYIIQEHRLDLQKFAEWIKDVGEGKILGAQLSEDSEPDWITIPKDYLIQNDEQGLVSLIDFVYPDLCNMHTNSSYLKERSILAPKNCDVDEINMIMLSRLGGMFVPIIVQIGYVQLMAVTRKKT